MTFASAGRKSIVIDVLESEETAFLEHVEWFRRGKTPSQMAAEARFQDGELALDALSELLQKSVGLDLASFVVARFLVAAARPDRVKFSFLEFQELDPPTLEQCLRVLRMVAVDKRPVDRFFPNGAAIFDGLELRAQHAEAMIRGRSQGTPDNNF